MRRTTSTAGAAKEGKVDATKPRAALGEVTNAAKKAAEKGKEGKALDKKVPVEKKPTLSSRSSNLTTATRRTRVIETVKEEKVAPKRKATATVRPTTSRSTTADIKPLVDKPVNGKVEQDEPARKKRKTSSPVTVHYDEDEFDEGKFDEDGREILLSSGGRAVRQKSPLRERAKDEGWEDLDAEDEGDPTMVSEYVVDAFNYMMKLEVSIASSRVIKLTPSARPWPTLITWMTRKSCSGGCAQSLWTGSSRSTQSSVSSPKHFSSLSTSLTVSYPNV